jgi:hypothetical protein
MFHEHCNARPMMRAAQFLYERFKFLRVFRFMKMSCAQINNS